MNWNARGSKQTIEAVVVDMVPEALLETVSVASRLLTIPTVRTTLASGRNLVFFLSGACFSPFHDDIVFRTFFNQLLTRFL